MSDIEQTAAAFPIPKASRIAWIDTETTGLVAGKHGIVQVGVLVEVDGKLVAEREFYMNPVGREIDPRALQVNGRTEEEIENYTNWIEVFEDFKEFFSEVKLLHGNAPFVFGGHNAPFDLRFLVDWGMASIGSLEANPFKDIIDVESVPLDTMAIGRMKGVREIVRQESNKLVDLCVAFGIEPDKEHDALGDIRMTREVYYKFLEALT